MRYLTVCAAVIALSAGCPVWAGPTPSTPPPVDPNAASDPARAALVARLIGELGHDRYRVREAAHQKLLTMADEATVAALKEATRHRDPEVAIRAEEILRKLLHHTHVVVDALGRSIAGAKLEIISAAGGAVASVVSNSLGFVFVDLPSADSGRCRVRFSHPQYGLATGALDVPGDKGVVRVPLVDRRTEAFRRALIGVVLGPDGKGVAGAGVRSTIVRTPGEGLIQYHKNLPAIRTDSAGRFAIYVPDTNPRRERGKLIPLNSRYTVKVTAPDGADLFPYAGEHHNTRPVTVRLRLSEHFHRFRFESPGGGFVTDPKDLVYLGVSYVQPDGRGAVALDRGYVDRGGKLLPGTYRGWDARTNTKFLPLTVTRGSPVELVFWLPPPVSFGGRVVDGITGKPAAGAFVMGYSGHAHNNLALLTGDEWEGLGALPAGQTQDHPAFKPLGRMYGVRAVTRTDRAGRYRITQKPARPFYGLIAFARDRLPYGQHKQALPAPDQAGRIAVPDMPLFPAATVVVEPVFEGKYLPVSPKWLIDGQAQPEWFGRFRAARRRGAQFEYVHWLKLNRPQAIFVPAGLRLRLRFETPYDDKWSNAVYDGTIRLEQGKTLSIGKVAFSPAVAISVRVVGPDGKPIEGVAVRRMYAGTNHSSVAHNTDADGLAYFHANPDSAGKLVVSALTRRNAVAGQPEPVVPFKVGWEAAQDTPYRIALTKEQVARLLGDRRTRR
ncbi:MAG: hypothetical protein ACYS5V_09345 [Planctomycetota bacterium]|jgi:hypothetical protein